MLFYATQVTPRTDGGAGIVGFRRWGSLAVPPQWLMAPGWTESDRSVPVETTEVELQGSSAKLRLVGAEVSILFPGRPAPEALPSVPDCFADLNLNQVDNWLAKKRDAGTIHTAFRTPLDDAELINFRLDVFDDLDNDDVAGSLAAFSAAARDVRRLVTAASQSNNRHVAEGFLMRAIDSYVAGVRTVADDLGRLPIRSAGLIGIRDFLGGYQVSEKFQRLADDNADLSRRLQAVHYALRVKGDKVTVTPERYSGDYGAEVLATFERFRQADAEDHLVQLRRSSAGYIESVILDFVARHNEELFAEVAAHVRRQSRFLDPVVGRFGHELEFYLSYLALMEQLRGSGIPFSRPTIVTEDTDAGPLLHVVQGVDLALALKGGQVVANDVTMADDQQFVVVTGPNQGGKTTFARMIGEVYYLAGLGCPVPAESARVTPASQIFTHFERQEDRDRETSGGKLEDDLIRIHDILQQADDRSLVVINEMFASTTLSDATYLGESILEQFERLGSTVIWVTFVEDLARRPKTVSMVSQTRRDDPTVRTFKVLAQPPAGRIYAEAIAARHGLRRQDIVRRVADHADGPTRPAAEGAGEED
ncbi:DNA mismatch repair protein MutS [Microlunatus endophyticus]